MAWQEVGVSEFLSYLKYQVLELISRLASIKTKAHERRN